MIGTGPAPALAGFSNSRDLGGWPTAAGGRTRFGSVIRSITPAALSAARLTVASVVLQSTIDLRSAVELAIAPHPLARSPGYVHRPLVDESAESIRDRSREETLGDVYAASVSRNGGTIAAVMRTIAAAPSGPLMICCAAGRDRTGMIAALLLDLAGVPRAAIERDYALTDGAIGGATPHQAGRPIRRMIDHLDEHFGGPRAYLTWLGLSVGEIGAVIRRLV